MTREEMSNAFDTLYNNINSNQAPSLTEYEKSVLLTKAQQQVIEDYFSPKRNKLQEGMEDSPNRQFDLSGIICQFSSTAVSGQQLQDQNKIDGRSKVYRFPKDALFILDEFITATIDGADRKCAVVPISYDTYLTLMSKPYKFPAKKQVWRLQNTNQGNPICELISAYPFSSMYVLRYVRRPRPIILDDFSSDNLSIQGLTGHYSGDDEDTTCDQSKWRVISGNSNYILSYDQASELDPQMHEAIVQKAVELAKAAISGDVNSHVAVGSFSETQSGFPMSKNNK